MSKSLKVKIFAADRIVDQGEARTIALQSRSNRVGDENIRSKHRGARSLRVDGRTIEKMTGDPL